MSRIMILAGLTVAQVLLAVPCVYAQGSTQSPLARAATIRCTFPLMALSSLKDEPLKAEVKSSSLEMQFEAVNADEGTAQLKVKNSVGAYDIIVRYAQGYLNFIQSFREGPLYVTTVLDQKNRAGKFKAVHSRHEYTAVSLPGFTSGPEQYYGECEILK